MRCAASAVLLLPAAAAPPPPPGWRVEAADPAARVVWRATKRGGEVEIDTRAGLTLWRDGALTGPVAISFEAMAVSAGGPNDRVSDLNAFWMATDPAAPDGSPLGRRDGGFEAYDTLRTYYVGIGGNGNATTRMRRYVGRAGERPLRPEHDRADAAAMLVPNRWTRVRLIADGRRIAVERDGRPLFAMDDPAPYARGWFGLRTTWSHLRVRNIRVTPLSRR